MYFPFLLLFLLLASCSGNKSISSARPRTVEDKYATQLGVSKEMLGNKHLYSFIDEWEGVKYQYGGRSKKGIDCSGFASVLYEHVMQKTIGGSSSSLYNQCARIADEELKEGDLVFFAIDSKEISHVGIYLQNHKFVHATTKAGVMIDDLRSDYYKKYYFGAGRVQ